MLRPTIREKTRDWLFTNSRDVTWKSCGATNEFQSGNVTPGAYFFDEAMGTAEAKSDEVDENEQPPTKTSVMRLLEPEHSNVNLVPPNVNLVSRNGNIGIAKGKIDPLNGTMESTAKTRDHYDAVEGHYEQ